MDPPEVIGAVPIKRQRLRSLELNGIQMAKMKEVTVGERWAYAVGENPPAIEVEVIAIDTSGRGRIVVRFTTEPDRDDEWTSPVRLKSLWPERAVYFRLIAKWRELASKPDDVEGGAVTAIFREFIAPAADINHGKLRGGTMSIYDADLVDVFIGGGLHELLAGVRSLEDEAGVHYDWATAVTVAEALCRAKPQRVTAYVHAEEAEGRALAAAASMERSLRRIQTTAFDFVFYEEYTRPMCDLLRSWCGKPSADVYDELRDLRGEVERLAGLAVDASRLLERAGESRGSREIYERAFPVQRDVEWKGAIAAE